MPERRELLEAIRHLTAALESSLDHPPEPTSDNAAKSVDTNIEVSQNPDTVSQVKVVGMTAEEFRQLRAGSGYTQEEVAAKLGVAPRTVTRWEAGRSRIDSWKARDIRFHLRPGAKEWERRNARVLDKLAGKTDKVSTSDGPTEAPEIPAKPLWVKDLSHV